MKVIIGATFDNYDKYCEKLNVSQSSVVSVANVMNAGLFDDIIVDMGINDRNSLIL